MAASTVDTRIPRRTKIPTRYEQFIRGDLSVEDLDMEELLRGQIRDKNGTFTGRPPLLIPRDFHVKVTQELLQRAEANWRSHMDDALQVFVEVMNNPKYGAQWRLQAAQYVFERIAGKIPDKQIIQASVAKWETVAERVLVEVAVDGDVVDAEVVGDSAVAVPELEPPMGVVWEDDPTESAAPPAPPRSAPRRPTRKSGGK